MGGRLEGGQKGGTTLGTPRIEEASLPQRGRARSPAGPAATLDKDAHAIRRMFADISPRYDLLNHLLSLNVDRLWRRRVVRELRPYLEPGARVLDACTGTADLALALQRALPDGAVFGTDFTPEMLQLAQRKCRQSKQGVQALCVADTLRLPFPEATFDVATVAFGMRNVADLKVGMRELFRVLKPGGAVAILEFSTPRLPGFRKAFQLYFHRVLPRLGALVSGSGRGKSAYAYLPASVAEFLPPRQFVELLGDDLGFVNVRLRTLSLGIAALYCGERPGAGDDS